jgi:nicotinamide phosphoribosyltransferase
MKMKTIITATDSYKMNHWAQYPEGLEAIYSYFESRVGAKYDETPLFGLQYFLKEYLVGPRVTQEGIDYAEKLCLAHFGDASMFNRAMWEHILKEHDGKLPVRIKAVPEGLPIPTGNVLMTVESLDPKCAPLTNHLETMLTHIWYGSTVCARSRYVRKMFKKFLKKTDTEETMGVALMFMLHDFGFRGVSSLESSAVGGAAHLANFMGTDTISAMEFAMEYYDAGMENLAFSVPATEHSVMTSQGRGGEEKLVKQLIKNYPNGILSVVSDSYDIENFIGNIGKKFKKEILGRDGKFVFRPDSLRYKTDTPEKQMLWIAKKLYEVFGGQKNEKGYITLHPKVGMLWGDGIDPDGIIRILEVLEENGFAASNCVFGMGGGLLQKVNRDTQRFAFKASAMKIDGKWVDIFKNPLDASKASKKGKLALIQVNSGEYLTIPESQLRNESENILKTVFENGELVTEYTFDEVRKNADLKDWE